MICIGQQLLASETTRASEPEGWTHKDNEKRWVAFGEVVGVESAKVPHIALASRGEHATQLSCEARRRR
eukprot:8353513-Alexandrium_andersonii.AAC.1